MSVSCRALKRAGFYILREGKHISMSDDKHIVIIPRHHTVKPGTLKQILDAAEISVEQFNDLLYPSTHPKLLLAALKRRPSLTTNRPPQLLTTGLCRVCDSTLADPLVPSCA